jgi:hypothetical protein
MSFAIPTLLTPLSAAVFPVLELFQSGYRLLNAFE